MINKIKEYLEVYIEKLSAAEVNSELPDDVKITHSYTKQAYKNVLSKIEWMEIPPESKQCKRILQLAIAREQDWNVIDQLNEIDLYSKIREVIPYIQAVSYKMNMEEKHLTEDLLSFCEKQLKVIDSSLYKKEIIFPTAEEVEKAFKSYTERIKPNKTPTLKVYKQPEVNEKIEELYQMFLELANSGSY